MNAYLAVADGGTAKDLIELRNPSETRISQYIDGLLEAAVSSTHATGENIQLICAELVEPGIDFSVPMLKIDEETQVISFSGMGLFHDHQYTGEKIEHDKTTLYMLLQGKRGKRARLTEKVEDDHESDIENYVTVTVMKNKHDLKVDVKEWEVSAKIKIKLFVRIVEYPSDHLYVKGKLDKVTKGLEEALTKDAEEIIAQIQEANSYVMGIGRRVKAYHPKAWKQMDWVEDYPEISIKPEVKVEILEHGIIN